MSGKRSRPEALPVLLAWSAATLLALVAGALSAANGRPPEISLAIALTGVVYAAAGTVASARQPRNPIGWMLVLASLLPSALIVLRYVFPVMLPLSVAFGTQLLTLPLAYVVLTFPTGRVTDRPTRWLLISAVLWAIIGGLAEVLSIEPSLALTAGACAPCVSNPLRVLDPTLYRAVQDLNAVIFIVLALATVGLVARRWHRSRGLNRSALAPIVIGGIAYAALYVVVFVMALTGNAFAELAIPLLLLARLLIPIGLVIVFVRFYAARSSVARSLLGLSRGMSLGTIEDALRTSLHDPGIVVGRRSPGSTTYQDRDQNAVDVVRVPEHQTVLEIGDRANPVAVVVHDAALDTDAELLSVVADAVAHALDVVDLRDDLAARGGDISRFPTGQVTFLMGDIERSTVLLGRLGDRWPELLTTFRGHVRAAAEHDRGEVVDLRADECFVVFRRPIDALNAARDLRDHLSSSAWPDDVQVAVRIGLHTGEPELTSGGYVGLDVHRAARVMATARGGQIVVSEAFANALGGEIPRAIELRSLGSVQLRGFESSEILFEAAAAD